MKSTAEQSINLLLRRLNAYLRPLGFRRFGKRFGRESKECWQVIALQTSLFSSGESKNVTVNFGVTPKHLMEFRGEDSSKAPLDWRCPIRFDISEPFKSKNYWWTIENEASAQSACSAIFGALEAGQLDLLNSLQTSDGILDMYRSGKVYGFEIDADETRLILLAHAEASTELSNRLRLYESTWVPKATEARATQFLEKFSNVFSGARKD